MGAYVQAAPLFDRALEIDQHLAAQDPKDSRALYDVVTILDDAAKSYEDAADPVLAANPDDRRVNLMLAERNLSQSAGDLEQLLKQDPNNDLWKAYLASTQVRLGVVRAVLHPPGVPPEASQHSLATLREVAEKDHASPLVLDQAASAFLTVEPASLRTPQFAVRCAEREVAMSHRTMPSRLLTLAHAYRASGDLEKCRATAREGLALLPTPLPGSVKPNIRKLLEKEAQGPP